MNLSVARRCSPQKLATNIVPTHCFSHPIAGIEKGTAEFMSVRDLGDSKGSNFMRKATLNGMLLSLVLVVVATLWVPLTPCAALAAEDKVSGAAADKPQVAQTHVVLVGINNYADKQIKPRKFAEEDAKALYALFTDKRYLDGEED